MTISIGIVKWFGGFNHHKDKVNDYGFLTDVEGFDVYLHEKGLQKNRAPNEDDIIVYNREKNGKKWKATNAFVLTSSAPELSQLLEWFELCESNSSFSGKFLTALSEIRSENAKCYSKEEMKSCLEVVTASKLVQILSVISDSWDYNLRQMVELKLVDPLVDIDWNILPETYSVANNEKFFADQLLSMDTDKAKRVVSTNYGMLTSPLKILVSFAGLLENQELLGKVIDDVSPFVCSLYHGEESQPDYLKKYIDEHVKPKGGVMKDPVLGPLYSLCQFKKYLYDKDIKFVALYESSDYLQSRFDVYILKELFSLIFEDNHWI